MAHSGLKDDHGERIVGLVYLSTDSRSDEMTTLTTSAVTLSVSNTYRPQRLPTIPPFIGYGFKLALRNWNQNDLPKIRMAFLSMRLQLGSSMPTNSCEMNMDEATFYRNMVKPRFDEWGDHSRVENAVGSGMPDINYAIFPRQGWCETKVIHSGKIFFEKFQLPWFKKRLRHTGGKDLWVLALDKDGVKLYAAADLVEAPREKIRKWSVVKTADVVPLVHVKKTEDWLAVRRAFLYEFTPTDLQHITQSQSGE